MTKKKPTGLAGFGIQNASPVNAASPATAPENAEMVSVEQGAATEAIEQAPPRQRGKGEMVALTLRVNREQWRRLHDLALAEGLSLNQLALYGLSEILVKRGLKPL